jgi:NAD/NADP transhydrogenase beta subunit
LECFWGCSYSFRPEIISFEFIIAGVVIGALIGAFAAKKVQMTAMPEMVAVFLTGLAAAPRHLLPGVNSHGSIPHCSKPRHWLPPDSVF